MDKVVKSLIAVVSALIMLAVAAYLTVHTLNQPISPPHELPQPTLAPTHTSSFFNFSKPVTP